MSPQCYVTRMLPVLLLTCFIVIVKEIVSTGILCVLFANFGAHLFGTLLSIAYIGLNTIGGGVLMVCDAQELVCRCCACWFQNYNLNKWWKCSIMKLSFS